MLSSRQVSEAARLLCSRLGEVAIAAAILRAQEARRRGAFVEMVDWRRIARRSCAVQQEPSQEDPGHENRRQSRHARSPHRRV